MSCRPSGLRCSGRARQILRERRPARLRTRSWSRGADDGHPQDAASCMAIIPTEPAAPRTRNVSPRITQSCFKMPNVASAATGRAAGIAPGDVCRLRRPRGREDLLRVAAEAGEQAGDVVPHMYARDGRTNRVDHASCLEAENGLRGKRKYGLDVAMPDLRVGGADPGSLDSDPHLTRPWLRQRYVPPDEDRLAVRTRCQQRL
jgi:hypothetical protein